MEKLGIKDWAKEDRPREKLLEKGASTLTDAELLAILIGSGNKDETVVELAQRILHKVDNNLNQLGKTSVKHLIKSFKGIGEAKAITIAAAMELGKRRQQSEALQVPQITNSLDAFQAFYPILADLAHEEVWAIFLNKGNKIISRFQVSKGGIDSSIVDIRLLMKEALSNHAVSIILAHNHPSGRLVISTQDKQITDQIVQAGKILNIPLLDHIIIANNQYISFKDQGLI